MAASFFRLSLLLYSNNRIIEESDVSFHINYVHVDHGERRLCVVKEVKICSFLKLTVKPCNGITI